MCGKLGTIFHSLDFSNDGAFSQHLSIYLI